MHLSPRKQRTLSTWLMRWAVLQPFVFSAGVANGQEQAEAF